jgi:hypothetical protein
MPLSIAISLNVIADIALVAGLAYVMTRAARLRPHAANVVTVPAASIPAPARRVPAATASRARALDARTPHTTPAGA